SPIPNFRETCRIQHTAVNTHAIQLLYTVYRRPSPHRYTSSIRTTWERLYIDVTINVRHRRNRLASSVDFSVASNVTTAFSPLPHHPASANKNNLPRMKHTL